MEEIILKECINKELSRSERLQLKVWLDESPKNRKIYAQMKLAFLSPGEGKRESMKEEVWSILKKDIKTSRQDSKASSGLIGNWVRVAAIFILCIGIGAIVYQSSYTPKEIAPVSEVKMIEKVSLPGQKITTVLPDGTIVKMNSGSKILVPSDFTGGTREVTLSGEAFFDVKRDESRPFIIKTDDIRVKVLGTSFNVRSYHDEKRSVVAVATGKVEVSGAGQKSYLTPGEKATYGKISEELSKEKYDWEQAFGWRENILSFDGEEFHEITRVLSRWYGVEFDVKSDGLALNKQFSGRYKDASLEAVLIGMSYVYDFKYDIENKRVTIK